MSREINAIDISNEIKLIQPIAIRNDADFTNISDEINARKNFISKLQELLNNSNRALLDLRIDELKDSEYKFCSYRNKFVYKFLGILPYFKKIYTNLQSRYSASFKKFRQQLCTSLSRVECFYELDDSGRKKYFNEFYIMRNKLNLKTSNDFEFVYSHSLCSYILDNYYLGINNLLDKSYSEIDTLNKFRDSMIEIWGRELPISLVSSLKSVVKFFDLSEVNYESLVKLHDKTSEDLKTLKNRDRYIMSEFNAMSEDLIYIRKLSKDCFVRYNKKAGKKLYTHFKDAINSGLGISDLNSEQKQSELKQTDLSPMISHLETVIKTLDNYNSFNLSFNYDIKQKSINISDKAIDKQKLDSCHLEQTHTYSYNSSSCKNTREQHTTII